MAEQMCSLKKRKEAGVQPTGDAVAGNVLAGKTFSNSSGVGLTGTMTNRGAVSKALNCGGSYTVPAGYHNGSGKVTANTLASQTKVDSGKTAINAGAVVSGYQGWVNGTKISGTRNANANIMETSFAIRCNSSGNGSVTLSTGGTVRAVCARVTEAPYTIIVAYPNNGRFPSTLYNTTLGASFNCTFSVSGATITFTSNNAYMANAYIYGPAYVVVA